MFDTVTSCMRCGVCGQDANQLTSLPTGVDHNGMTAYSTMCPQCLDAWSKAQAAKDIHIHIHIHQYPPVQVAPFWIGGAYPQPLDMGPPYFGHFTWCSADDVGCSSQSSCLAAVA